MKNISILFLILIATGAFGQSKSYDYAYMNKKGICVYSIADKKEYLIVSKGENPCISPDGKKLAYTALDQNGGRFIAVIDLNTKKKTILNTNSNNCYGPVWSPNGNYIAYNVFDSQKSNWLIAVIDAGNTEPVVLTRQLEQSYMPTWTYDNKNVVVQNMEKVFVFDLSGNLVKDYKVSDMTKDLGPTSSDRFIFTKDNKKIVFSSSVDEPGGKDGPPSAVFIYDIDSNSTLRLSPKGYWSDDVIIKDNKVLFTASKMTSVIQNVYVVDTDGKNFKILFPNCYDLTAKN